MNNPFISIIIPTYNRSHYIEITLDSFLNQSYDNNNYEIIIVNNNSTDNTAAILEKYKYNYPDKVTILLETKQGVHYARNTAAKIAKGTILYYTDDDMIADKELLKNIIIPFQIDNKVASVTGKVIPKWENQEPPKWIKKYCSNSLLSLNFSKKEDIIISKFDVGVYSCHQAILKDVFFNSGGFNPENTAGIWIGDGETGLNIKIKELGFKFGYIATAVIQHIIPIERTTQNYLNKRFKNQANCDSYAKYRVLNRNNKKLELNKTILSNNLFALKNYLYFILKYLTFNDGWHLSLARYYYHLEVIKYNKKIENDDEFKKLVLKIDWLNNF